MPVPDFAVGEKLLDIDMDSVGLWRIATQTIGVGVSSVTVSNVFSADFENYKIVVSGGTGSAQPQFLTMRLAGLLNDYVWAQKGVTYAGVASGAGSGASATEWRVGYIANSGAGMNIDLFNPFTTGIRAMFVGSSASSSTTFGQYKFGGVATDTASSTGFTLLTTGGATISNGRIMVYGYNNSFPSFRS
jgi:hypothetical protein